jgi:hypothetical protein
VGEHSAPHDPRAIANMILDEGERTKGTTAVRLDPIALCMKILGWPETGDDERLN